MGTRQAHPASAVGLARTLWSPRLAALAVAGAAVVPYLGTLDGYFLADDFGVLYLFSDKPPLHVLRLFTMPWTENLYGAWTDELRPTLALTFQLGWFLGNGSPVAFHLALVLYHLATSLLVLAIGRDVARLAPPAALFAAVLFAVLPVQAETLAWFQGLADSVPTLFFLATLWTYARWRQGRGRWLYGVSLAAYFLALYSKQSAVTLPLALLLHDLLLGRGGGAGPARGLPYRAYLPYLGLILGYLLLRVALFGQALREGGLGLATVVVFALEQATHLQLLVFGEPLVQVPVVVPALGIALVATSQWLLLRTLLQRGASATRRTLAFFGPGWWLVAVGPLAATYTTPRHLYLAAAGLTIGLAAAAQAGLARRPATHSSAAVVAALAAVLLVAAVVTGQARLDDWRRAADVSLRVQADLVREATAAPPGSLLVVGAPPRGRADTLVTWVWAWALPYAARPPFSPTDLTQRVSLIEPLEVFCCWDGPLWQTHVAEQVATWAARPERPPVVLLWWDQRSGVLQRRTDVEDPSARAAALALLDARDDKAELARRVQALVARAASVGPS